MYIKTSLYLFVLGGCVFTNPQDQSKEAPTQISTQTHASSSSSGHALFLVNVDQLRLRNYGNTKSEMVATLDENTLVYFLDEQTDYKETIGGHKGPWLKVQTSDGKYSGWVFGAEFFVEEWLSRTRIDSIRSTGKAIKIFNNLNKSELTELTGVNAESTERGTRFSGYYEYDEGGDDQVVNGDVVMRARVFDPESKKVSFVPCHFVVQKGMPSSIPDCIQ